MRLNKYLKVSRIIKKAHRRQRGDAKSMSVNGKPARASYDVKVGRRDRLTFGPNTSRFEVLSVTEHATRRAPLSCSASFN